MESNTTLCLNSAAPDRVGQEPMAEKKNSAGSAKKMKVIIQAAADLFRYMNHIIL